MARKKGACANDGGASGDPPGFFFPGSVSFFPVQFLFFQFSFPSTNPIPDMDQTSEMNNEWTGALALMTNASERYNTCLCIRNLPTPPSGGFRRSDSTAEFRPVLALHVFTLRRSLWLGVLTAVAFISVGEGGDAPGR